MNENQVSGDAAPEWSFKDESPSESSPPSTTPVEEVTWTASEYIAHQKGAGWYLALMAAAAAAAVLMYLITQDRVTSAVVVIMAFIFGVFASRQPRVLTYKLQSNGITIADKLYSYSEFRSFAVQEEGALNSIFLMPFKRFHPGISLYYPPDQEDAIINALGNYLPHEDRPPDMVDRFMRNIRF